MSDRGQRLSSVFFRRGNLFEFIKAGASFRREHADRTVETAEVLDVFTDLYSIPHVRFEFTLRHPGREPYGSGPRTMALKTFCQHYVERLSR
ncbi:MAG TPA: hypothetical protein VL244_06835 [Alphaproteobacteria bacterium]|nr:hypothetical protein [Alphaproteobacteria bacterium]